MNTALPNWLPTHATPGSVETAVAQTRQALRHGEGTIYLTGTGALEAAGAVAARNQGPLVCARMAGCESIEDAVLVVGWAMGLLAPGSHLELGRALRKLRGPMILLDGRGMQEDLLHGLKKKLTPVTHEARWILVVDAGVAPTNSIGAGVLGEAPSPPFSDRLPIQAHALGWLLAGIPGAAEEAFSCRVPGLNRQAIWPTAARHLRTQSTHSASRIADALGPEFQRHLQIGLGGPVPQGTLPADFFALRWIGRHASEVGHATMAIAAACRLALAWSMPGEANALIEEALPRTPSSDGTCQALLQWAHARVAMDTGDRTMADKRFEEATVSLRGERNLSLLACATRHWAELHATRGEPATAAQHLRSARALYRQLDNKAGVAATLRAAGDGAIASGETLSAEALFDQAQVDGGTPIEQVNLLLSQTTLAIARGEHHRSRTLLEAASKGAVGEPLLEANVRRRAADMAFREGDHERAESEVHAARFAYARLGEAASLARCTRLLGDIDAARGRLAEAALWYEEAIETQINIGDHRGLHRTLTHAATLEQVSGDDILARELDRMASRLQPTQSPR